MLFVDVIRKKRDGGELNSAELAMFVDGLADGSLPAEQVSALAMAVFLNSMSVAEASALTDRMARSGQMLDWSASELGGPIVDKHSTGGIGDKVSFMLAPIAAACGCFVPMISGRGLGHSGGTLDKVGSIPGYDPYPNADRFRQVVRDVGCAIIGQTGDLAPADRRLYSIRDVTATVESVPLITASILSKKIAAGLEGLVMDIKYGSGAFMSNVEQARELARSIIGTGTASGLRTHAVLTDMNENLGTTAGNAVELREAVGFLTGGAREPRLNEVTSSLVAEMLIVGGLETDQQKAAARIEQAISSGLAAEVFGKMVGALGGPADFLERTDRYLPAAAIQRPVPAGSAGYLSAVDGRCFGNAIIELGGGRRKLEDELDLSVGFTEVLPIGSRVERDTPLAVIHAASEASADRAANMLRQACNITPESASERPVVLEVIDDV